MILGQYDEKYRKGTKLISEANTREEWIDVAKFLAIVAVMIDHTHHILYENKAISMFSYYSVSLFILVMGVTTYWSMSRCHDNMYCKVWNKCWSILRPYLFATFVYEIFANHSFSLENFIYNITHFNATGPLYYVLLYVQLVIVSPVLVCFLNKEKKFNSVIEIVGMCVILFISYLTTNYTNILDVYGGGGKLFGGTYLVLLYLGMLYGKYMANIKRITTTQKAPLCLAFGIVSGIALVLWMIHMKYNGFLLDSYLSFGLGKNPPSLTLFVYTILVVLCLFFGNQFVDIVDVLWIKRVRKGIAYLGKHTLYIFLYHIFVFDYVLEPLVDWLDLDNIWILRIIYFVVTIFVSLLFECLITKLLKYMRVAYQLKK